MMLLVLGSAAAYCCQIPVYRYALEFWAIEPYTAVLFVPEDMKAEGEAAVKHLRETAEKAHANLRVRILASGDLAKVYPQLAESGKTNIMLAIEFTRSTVRRVPA